MSAVEIVLIAAAVIFVIGRRLVGEPLQARRLLLMPAVLGIWGFTQLGHLDPAAIAVLVAEAVVALGLGAARGLTIAVYEQAGHLWYRYRPMTLAVWVATIGVRVAMVLGASAIGVNLPTSASILLTFGVSLAGEAAVVAARAQRTGVPYAPDRRTARAAAATGRRDR
jgi:hypothetical protein